MYDFYDRLQRNIAKPDQNKSCVGCTGVIALWKINKFQKIEKKLKCLNFELWETNTPANILSGFCHQVELWEQLSWSAVLLENHREPQDGLKPNKAFSQIRKKQTNDAF